ncbi:heavy metal translocating P-type ATPase [Legionella qingyii]|uniref:Cation-translocating P-type ATPase n=1 Tax=Legionella qingyii TaxID=2184757 RepID=A0A317TYV4_9GAMM|nr:cation-translocating P-type ATPase [Legionella qingyii]PWY54691.1 heavy metal translocating P-type ATPase [Legionella qingyii]RUR20405.1 cation-translocating P-type ATPase [Legionella qingyii]RUR29416.1 cation-translocating P-type ATPase [Legionella qingyii]
MSKFKTYTFYVDGMTCISCSKTLENYLKEKLEGRFKGFHVDVTTPDPKRAIITLEEDQEHDDPYEVWTEVKGYIDELFSCREFGYRPINEEPSEEAQVKNQQPNNLEKAKSFFTSHWFLGGVGCVSGLVVLIICLATSGLPLAVMGSLAVFSTLLTLILGANSYYDAWIKLTKAKTLTMDSLFALSTASILVVSFASLFVPWLPMMFEAGLLIYGFRHIGIAIEETIKEKIGTAKFQDRAPKSVRKKANQDFDEIKIDKINVNDVIIVYPGEIIPLDGICEDESLIYKTIDTGAILPQYFPPHTEVLAGMRLADNEKPLAIRVTKIQSESYLARLDKAIEISALEKAPIEIKTGQLLTYFIPAVIALAAASGVIIGVFFPAAVAIQCAVSVLVSACPCTLGLITPLAVKTGMHKAAEHGVQFKSAKILQQAEQIDTVIFDLNGTLTTGVPSVRELYLFEESNLSEIEFLSYCAALEKESSHPIGKAIYSFANQVEIKNVEANLLDHTHHSGISGMIKNKDYVIGSMTVMKEKGIEIPLNFKHPNLQAGDQIVYVARNKVAIGFLVITDPLRDDAYCTIRALKAIGKKICLCTGADEETAHRYAQALGIETVYANCVASSLKRNENHLSKTSHIKALRRKGHKVAMIGDAGNDTPAITASDLGIAVVSDGSDILTQQAAGIVIHNGALLSIASAFAVSKQTVSNINQNLVMSLIYNLGSILVSGGLLVAIGLTLNPVVGVALMIFQACMILMNVYRFKQQPLEHLQQEKKQYQEASSPRESSHAKMNKYKSENSKDCLCDQEPTHVKPANAPAPSFWSYCMPNGSSTKEEEEELLLLRNIKNESIMNSANCSFKY